MTTLACGVETPATKPLWSCAIDAMRAITCGVWKNRKEQGFTVGHGSVMPAKAFSLYGERQM